MANQTQVECNQLLHAHLFVQILTCLNEGKYVLKLNHA